MNFIYSNRPFNDSTKVVDNFFVDSNTDYIKRKKIVFIFDGVLYPEVDISKEDLAEKLLKDVDEISNIKGYFSGMLFDIENKKIYAFNDKLGIKDLYYYKKGERLFVSNKVTKIQNNLNFKDEELDLQAIQEFLIFGYPLYRKTFLKNVSYTSLASILSCEVDNLKTNLKNYWDYEFHINEDLTMNEAIERLDLLVNQAMLRIKKMNQSETYGLGLSGGLDSRVVAYYALKNNMNLKAFIFGEKNSDAYYISQKIANTLGIKLHKLGVNKDFLDYKEEHMNYNSMISLLHAWYYAIYNRLPNFNALLCGFLGGEQFGNHLKINDNHISTYDNLLKSIFFKYDEVNATSRINNFLKFDKLTDIKKEIKHESQTSKNKCFWQFKEEFNFRNRQLKYIKNLAPMSFYGKYRMNSPFIDFDFMNFMMSLPFHMRLDKSLYKKFLKCINSKLFKIRSERMLTNKESKLFRVSLKILKLVDKNILKTNFLYKNSHKNHINWMKNSNLKQSISSLSNNTKIIPNEIFNNKETNILMNNPKDNKDIKLLFRILTVKSWLYNAFIKN